MKNQSFQSNNRHSRRMENSLRRKDAARKTSMVLRLPSNCDVFTLLSGMLNSIADEVHSKQSD